MKIVPDITENAALNGSSFDASLTTEASQWLHSLRQTYLSCTVTLLLPHISFASFN